MKYKYNECPDHCDYSVDLDARCIREYFRTFPPRPGVNLFEMGVGNRRFDLIHLCPSPRYVKIFEFKVSRRDFLADKKWMHYLEFCNAFAFVCPAGLIQKNEVPPGIGLLWVWQWRHKHTEHWWYGSQWVKKVRNREMDRDVLLHLSLSLLQRVLYRKDDVF